MYSNNDCEKKRIFFFCVVLSQMICEQRCVMCTEIYCYKFLNYYRLLGWVDNFMDNLQDNVEVDLCLWKYGEIGFSLELCSLMFVLLSTINYGREFVYFLKFDH